MIVIDASVLAVALCDDGAHGNVIRAELTPQTLSAPQLIDVETTSVIRKSLRAGLLTDHRAALAMVDLSDIPIERVPHRGLLDRIWQLHKNVTPYDAAYVALAELLDVPLWTFDARLAKAPKVRCEIRVMAT